MGYAFFLLSMAINLISFIFALIAISCALKQLMQLIIIQIQRFFIK